jgi:hypothetical protein
MSAPSPAQRLRTRFVSFGLWTAVAAFVAIEGDALLDQSEIGHASAVFMLGTACLAAAACLGLFAVITAVGLAVSAMFSDEPPPEQSQGSSGSVRPVNDHGYPRTDTGIKPDATRRPALLSKSKRHLRGLGS